MKISNVTEIFDNGEFITIVTCCGCVHLPMDGKHSITILPIEDSKEAICIVIIDFYQDT